MRANLSACFRRLNAAQTNLDTLKVHIQGAIDAYGKPVVLMGLKQDRQTNAALVYAKDAMPFDPTWADEIGHIVYDLRSALDQLMTQLYIATNNRRPPKRIGRTKGPGRTLQFPICTTRKAFDAEIRKGRMDGLDDRFQHLIWHYQPMRLKGIRAARNHALAMLEMLSNTDKHNYPNITGWAYESLRLHANPIAGSCVVTNISIAPGASRLIKRRSNIGRVHFVAAGIGKPGIEVYLDGTAHPAFDSGHWVEQVLGAVVTDVGGVVRDARALIDLNPPAHLVASATAKTRGKAPPPWPTP